VYPNASCPVFGEPDIESSTETPIAQAIAEGYRYTDRFIDEYNLDPRRLILDET
jgi:hypothetical protein